MNPKVASTFVSDALADRVNEGEGRLRAFSAEAEAHPFAVAVAFDDVIIELPGNSPDLVHVGPGDPAREFAFSLIHQDRQHADLDTLVEIFASARKTQTQTLVEMDMSHG